MMFGGLRVVENPWLTESQTFDVKRSWRERLFSRPWRPFQPTKRVTVQVPSKQCFVTAGVVYMHPEMVRKLRETIGKSAI